MWLKAVEPDLGSDPVIVTDSWNYTVDEPKGFIRLKIISGFIRGYPNRGKYEKAGSLSNENRKQTVFASKCISTKLS